MATRLFAILVVALAMQVGRVSREPVRFIRLDTAYATFRQDGIKVVDAAEVEGVVDALSQFAEPTQRIVLCAGDDIYAAVRTSESSFARADSDKPVVVGTRREPVWVAVYLGSDGSLPSAYRLHGVEVNGTTIRVTYAVDDQSATRTADLFAYLTWVPLGLTTAGEYNLELFDLTSGQVTQTSKWQVILE